MSEKLYTFSEVVEKGLLGMKHRRLRDVIKNKEIEVINISQGGKRPTYRFSQSAIDAYLAKSTTNASETAPTEDDQPSN